LHLKVKKSVKLAGRPGTKGRLPDLDAMGFAHFGATFYLPVAADRAREAAARILGTEQLAGGQLRFDYVAGGLRNQLLLNIHEDTRQPKGASLVSLSFRNPHLEDDFAELAAGQPLLAQMMEGVSLGERGFYHDWLGLWLTDADELTEGGGASRLRQVLAAAGDLAASPVPVSAGANFFFQLPLGPSGSGALTQTVPGLGKLHLTRFEMELDAGGTVTLWFGEHRRTSGIARRRPVPSGSRREIVGPPVVPINRGTTLEEALLYPRAAGVFSKCLGPDWRVRYKEWSTQSFGMLADMNIMKPAEVERLVNELQRLAKPRARAAARTDVGPMFEHGSPQAVAISVENVTFQDALGADALYRASHRLFKIVQAFLRLLPKDEKK
jgi:hypothetical protein